jgi:hypothetical protein
MNLFHLKSLIVIYASELHPTFILWLWQQFLTIVVCFHPSHSKHENTKEKKIGMKDENEGVKVEKKVHCVWASPS